MLESWSLIYMGNIYEIPAWTKLVTYLVIYLIMDLLYSNEGLYTEYQSISYW
jgi:hypothetical protein